MTHISEPFDQGPEAKALRLIAAAPALLEALMACENYLSAIDDAADWRDRPLVHNLCIKAKAAIALAKGEQAQGKERTQEFYNKLSFAKGD